MLQYFQDFRRVDVMMLCFCQYMFAQKGFFILEFYFGGGLFLVCIAYLMQKKSVFFLRVFVLLKNDFIHVRFLLCLYQFYRVSGYFSVFCSSCF